MKKLRKLFALLLCVGLCMSLAPGAEAAGTYDAEAAVSYAASHWNDGQGLCAAFVSRCLQAGGLDIPVYSTTDKIVSWLSSNGYERVPLVGQTGGNWNSFFVKDNPSISAGDIVCYCPKGKNTVDINPYHVVIVSNKNSKKYAGSYDRLTAYGHNDAWNSIPLDSYISKDGNINDAYAFRIRSLDPTPDSPNLIVTANNATNVTSNNANLTGFIHYGNYQPVQWGVDCGTSSSNLQCVIFKDSSKQVINSGDGMSISFNFKNDSTRDTSSPNTPYYPLKANTTYYYRFWVKYRNDQYVHSELKEFKTSNATIPSFSDISVGNITNTTARLYYTINYGADNVPKYYGVYLGTSASNMTKAVLNMEQYKENRKLESTHQPIAGTNLEKDWPSGPITNNYIDFGSEGPTLSPGTTYYYKLWITDNSGNNEYCSDVKQFTTNGTATTYTIKFDANGGTGAPGNQTKTQGTALTLSSTKPTRANSSAGSYKVTLNANGGSASPASMDAARTTSYTFKNWNTKADGTGTSYNAGASYTANASTTLYAQWNSSTSTAEVTLPTPTRTGHTFKGWSTSSTATSGSTGKYTPNGNVTLYAVWEANKYTVSYNANGGTGAPANQTKTHGTNLTLSSTKPTRANSSAESYTVTLNANGGSVSATSLDAARTTSYTFKNWNTKQDGSGTSYNAGTSYTANEAATLYAQWNSSTTTAAVTLPTPTRTGYTFKGWGTSSTASTGVTGNYTPTGNVTLYAVWETNGIAVSENSFPDAAFRAYVSENCDSNHDGYLSDSEINNVKQMNCTGSADAPGAIASLKGIELFPMLEELNCNYNQITELDVSKNPALQKLYCYSNKLTTLDVSQNGALQELFCGQNQLGTLELGAKNKLEVLNCERNNLSSISVKQCPNLAVLHCNDNQLETLDVSNSNKLQLLVCYKNRLKSIELGELPELNSLNCSQNEIKALNVEKCGALESLVCWENELEQLNVVSLKNLTVLGCDSNKIASLNVESNTKLQELYCYNNNLETLNVSNNPDLWLLWCGENKFTSLDLSKNAKLEDFQCYDSQLTSLILGSKPALRRISVDGNALSSLNLITATALVRLDCANNHLTQLILGSHNFLEQMDCSGNQLKALNVTNCAKLVQLMQDAAPITENGVIGYEFAIDEDYIRYFWYDEGVQLSESVITPDLTLPAALTTIESEAFAGGGFNSVLIPPTVKEIASDAFGDRTDLIILGTSGSYAETFAGEKHFTFVPAA